MTVQLLVKSDDLVKTWLSERIGGIDFGPSATIGFAENGKIIGGIVFNQFVRSPAGDAISIEISILTESKRWCTRANIKQIFEYPFKQLGVKRLQSTCAIGNTISQRFMEHIGFTYEGTGREAWPLGGDAVVYSMLKHECKWTK